jgi:hypothetical protein
MVLVGLPLASPAFADDALQPWIGNPAGWSNIGSFGNLWMDPGEKLSLVFGSKGQATTPEATMTLPNYPGLSLRPAQAGCDSVGPAVHCTGAVDDKGLMWGDAELAADASTPLGYAGLVVVTTPGGGRATIPLWITSKARGSDMETRTTNTSGKIGDVVSVTVTVINHGPSPEPWWGLGRIHASGATLVGQHGCSPGTLSGSQWQCAHQAFTAVGEQTTLTFDFKIVSAVATGNFGGFDYIALLNDPDMNNLQFSFKLSLTGGGGAGGGGSADGQAAVPTGPQTTTPATASPTSAPPTNPTEVPARLAASQQTITSNTILVAGVGMAAVLLLGFGALGFRRIRRFATPDSTVDTPDGENKTP